MDANAAKFDWKQLIFLILKLFFGAAQVTQLEFKLFNFFLFLVEFFEPSEVLKQNCTAKICLSIRILLKFSWLL